MDTQVAKDAAAAVIAQHLPELIALSHSVHSTPELCFNETRSAHAVADALRAGGLTVTEGVYDIPTALESRSGQACMSGSSARPPRRGVAAKSSCWTVAPSTASTPP